MQHQQLGLFLVRLLLVNCWPTFAILSTSVLGGSYHPKFICGSICMSHCKDLEWSLIPLNLALFFAITHVHYENTGGESDGAPKAFAKPSFLRCG